MKILIKKLPYTKSMLVKRTDYNSKNIYIYSIRICICNTYLKTKYVVLKIYFAMLSLPWKPQRYSWFSRKNSLQQENGKLQTQMEIKQKK